MADSWCTIESDPGVFTELISTFGVKGVQVEELYSLDEETFAQNAPIYGLIFLFKYKSEKDDRPVVSPEAAPELFFANQVIPNACATQAILSILLNLEGGAGFDLGPTLGEFKAFTGDFSADIKGLAIGNSASIREAHNSFARAEPFMMEESKVATDKDDVFHFIAYVPHGGSVYELDGLKSGPIHLGEFSAAAAGDGSGGGWLDVARPAIESRIARYASSEIRFNLMGLVRNKKEAWLEKRSVLEARAAALAAADGGAAAMEDGPAATGDAGSDGFTVAADAGARAAQAAEVQTALGECARRIAAEEEKFAAWRMDNVRRKHNYIPFVVNLLRMLAERNHLKPMLDKAQAPKRE